MGICGRDSDLTYSGFWHPPEQSPGYVPASGGGVSMVTPVPLALRKMETSQSSHQLVTQMLKENTHDISCWRRSLNQSALGITGADWLVANASYVGLSHIFSMS